MAALHQIYIVSLIQQIKILIYNLLYCFSEYSNCFIRVIDCSIRVSYLCNLQSENRKGIVINGVPIWKTNYRHSHLIDLIKLCVGEVKGKGVL